MAKKTFQIKAGLVQALDDTVTSAKNNSGELYFEIIHLRKIELDPENPRDLALNFLDVINGILETDPLSTRKKQEKQALSSLVHSIREQGVINPIIVYKHNEKFRVIAGERRTLASLLAKKEDIPAKILTEKPSRLKLSLLQWIENIEREDLSLWERMNNLEKITLAYAENHNKSALAITPTELAQLLGCSLQQAVNYTNVLAASDNIKNHIQANKIKNIEKASLIARAPKELHEQLLFACTQGATLKELKNILKNELTSSLIKHPLKKMRNKIQLGYTSNSAVVKTILQALSRNDSLHHISKYIEEISWDDNQAISDAFRKIILILEHTSQDAIS